MRVQSSSSWKQPGVLHSVLQAEAEQLECRVHWDTPGLALEPHHQQQRLHCLCSVALSMSLHLVRHQLYHTKSSTHVCVLPPSPNKCAWLGFPRWLCRTMQTAHQMSPCSRTTQPPCQHTSSSTTSTLLRPPAQTTTSSPQQPRRQPQVVLAAALRTLCLHSCMVWMASTAAGCRVLLSDPTLLSS